MAARLAIATLLIGLAAPLGAAAADSTAPVVTALAIEDDGTISLADGRRLRLAAIDLPDGRLRHEAHDALARMIADGPLTLAADGASQDRYGRLVAQVYDRHRDWLQGELLRQGLARVATTPDHRAFALELLAAEKPARTHRLGLWADPQYALRQADGVSRLLDTWQVVEGRVTIAEPRHNGIDLVLGDDRAHDLTVRISVAMARDLGADRAALTGKRIRVRGWIGKTEGPTIVLNHAEQLEIVDHVRRTEAE